MSQKVQFIATVIARPELVLLDEPFSGLDPINATVLREMVLDLKKQGATVIFSTHDMGVAEKMCDSIFMIFRGRKMLDGSLESIQRDFGADTVRVEFRQPASLTDLPGVLGVTDFGKYQELRVERDCDSQRLLGTLMQRGAVRHFEIAHPTLQDIFVRIANGS
jgi:ABC-2 type transport system ATP-binding protein